MTPPPIAKALILNDTSRECHHGCDLVMRHLHKALKERGIAVLASCPVGKNWKEDNLFLKALEQADIAIVNGEGTIHHDQPSGLLLLEFAAHARSATVKVVLINTVFQDISEKYWHHLKNFDAIWCRESLSAEAVRHAGSQARVAADLSFLYDIPTAKGERQGVGATDSVYKELSKEALMFCRQHNARFLPALQRYRIRDYTVFRNYLSAFKATLLWVLYSVIKNFGLNYEQTRTTYLQRYPEDHMKSISKLQLLIAGRFHSLCFALKGHTPFVALKSNSHKVEGLLQDIGLSSKRMIDKSKLSRLNPEDFSLSKEEKENIDRYLQKAKTDINAMFDQILELAKLQA